MINQMVHARSSSWIEASIVAITLFCLPLFEAPKNIMSVCFLVVWCIQAARKRSIGLPCQFNWPILGLASILWIAPHFSEFGDIITPLNSAHRWTLLALFVIFAARLDYSKNQMILILAALLSGGAMAVVESFWIWSLNGKAAPEFRSVGHVNHSSMYTLVTLAAGIGAMHVRANFIQYLGLVATISTLAFLPPSSSLVGGVAVLVILMVGTAVPAIMRWSIRGLVASSVASSLTVFAVLATPAAQGFRSEFMSRFDENFFSGRDKILNSALAVWENHPVFGTGWFSFGLATSEEVVRAALARAGSEYDPSVYWHHAHGHNLWTTMLIERGLLGVALVSVLLLLYFVAFAPIAFSRERLDPLDRCAAVGALLVAVGFAVAGLGNTTMMNEHGHAGMALIAVAYGYLRGRGILPRKSE